MSDLLPTLHGLLQSDPLPMMLVDASGQPMFRNRALLALASDAGGYFYVLAISNVGYLTFNFLNLNAYSGRQRWRRASPPTLR